MFIATLLKLSFAFTLPITNVLCLTIVMTRNTFIYYLQFNILKQKQKYGNLYTPNNNDNLQNVKITFLHMI